jgi:hypothetical protein
MSKGLYSSDVGSLMYAMVCSHPNLSHAMSIVSRYMANPSREHWKVVQWILRYLCGSSNACLCFGESIDGLFGYVYSDYAGDLDKRRYLSGYVFTIGGCVVSWKACLWATIVMSTIEAKYMATVETTKEALWLKGVYSEPCDIKSCITIYCDSHSAIYLTKDKMVTKRTKHININYHFVHDVIISIRLSLMIILLIR